jgi:Phospholipase B
MTSRMSSLGLLLALAAGLASPVLAQTPLTPEENSVLQRARRVEKNGWIYVHVEGAPFDRGFQHGYLLAKEIDNALRMLRYETPIDTGLDFAFFVEQGRQMFDPKISEEFRQEMKGIAAGATRAGVAVTYEEILAWNGYEELVDYWYPTVQSTFAGLAAKGEHCSAFIATGNATKDGGIVIGHDDWDEFQHGQHFNIIMDLKPDGGQRAIMQTGPGLIDSFTDFWINDAGLVCIETTMAGFNDYKTNEEPEFFRARRAMQYGRSIDEFVALMQRKNNGGYANIWLVGDIKTHEIAKFEQGLKFQNLARKKDGWFSGYNAPEDVRILNFECSYIGVDDVRWPTGSRRVRWNQLLTQNYGKIDVELGKQMLADQYDVYLNKINPGSRTIEGHYELDAREYLTINGRPPYQPMGAVDGKITDSTMAARLMLSARWGNASGTPFDAAAFLAAHPQWSWLQGYLYDRPTQPWTDFTAGEGQ